MKQQLKSLAQTYGVSEDEALQILLNMHDNIANNQGLNELVSIALNPDAQEDQKRHLNMALGGYADNIKLFDDVLLSLVQQQYPDASLELLIENLNKVQPEGGEQLNSKETIMRAIAMLAPASADNVGAVDNTQDAIRDSLEEAQAQANEDISPPDKNTRPLEEANIPSQNRSSDDEGKNKYGAAYRKYFLSKNN